MDIRARGPAALLPQALPKLACLHGLQATRPVKLFPRLHPGATLLGRYFHVTRMPLLPHFIRPPGVSLFGFVN